MRRAGIVVAIGLWLAAGTSLGGPPPEDIGIEGLSTGDSRSSARAALERLGLPVQDESGVLVTQFRDKASNQDVRARIEFVGSGEAGTMSGVTFIMSDKDASWRQTSAWDRWMRAKPLRFKQSVYCRGDSAFVLVMNRDDTAMLMIRTPLAPAFPCAGMGSGASTDLTLYRVADMAAAGKPLPKPVDPSAPPDAEALYRAGAAQYRGNDFTRAAGYLTRAANLGHAKAMVLLADVLVNGPDEQRNDAVAMQWYRRAAGLNEPGGMIGIAWMYDHGRGVARDPAQALAWYRKAEAAGGNSMGETGALDREIRRRSDRDRRNAPETLRCLRFVDVLVPTTVDGKTRREDDGSIVQERYRGPDVLAKRLRNQCGRPVETVFQCRTGRVVMSLVPGRDYVPNDLPSGTIEGLSVPPSFLDGIVTFRSELCE